jgi:hypothetical protein
MNLLDLNTRFPDEASCVAYLKQKREEEGIVCEKCHGSDHYWLETVLVWKCKNCGNRISLKSGTLMEKTHIPLKTWFIVIHLMTSTKKAFSALEIQKQTGLKFYEPIWYMMQKIRLAMGKRDAKYKLQGDIEIDDGFYKVVNLPEENVVKRKGTNENRGRGSFIHAKVLVMVESRPNPKQKNPHKKKRILGFAKMIVVDELNSVGINYEVMKAMSPTSIVISDAYRGYAGLSEIVDEHNAMVVPQSEAHTKLPWVHTVIANSKRQLLGVHHSIGREFLQNYLNEFTYKLNRRTFQSDLFDRMLVCGAHDTWY